MWTCSSHVQVRFTWSRTWTSSPLPPARTMAERRGWDAAFGRLSAPRLTCAGPPWCVGCLAPKVWACLLILSFLASTAA